MTKTDGTNLVAHVAGSVSYYLVIILDRRKIVKKLTVTDIHNTIHLEIAIIDLVVFRG